MADDRVLMSVFVSVGEGGPDLSVRTSMVMVATALGQNGAVLYL